MSEPARAPRVQIVWDPSVRALLTAAVRQTLNALLPHLERLAAEEPSPVTRIEVRGYVDPEEGSKQVVIRVWTDLPAEPALDYWDRLGEAFDTWLGTLPPRLARVAAEQIHLSVEWRSDDRAA